MENRLKIHHQPTVLASSKIPSRILGLVSAGQRLMKKLV
jgi:hypothetical protein